MARPQVRSKGSRMAIDGEFENKIISDVRSTIVDRY